LAGLRRIKFLGTQFFTAKASFFQALVSMYDSNEQGLNMLLQAGAFLFARYNYNTNVKVFQE